MVKINDVSHLIIICYLLLSQSACFKNATNHGKNGAASKIDVSKTYQQIDIHALDKSLLNYLIQEQVNELRKKKKLWALKIDPFLKQAALDHNNYMATYEKLQHEQHHWGKENVLDRVRLAKGKHHKLGENLQFLGFTVLLKGEEKSVLAPTYAAAAEEIVENWISSKSHYDNLIHKGFDYFGTAILYHPKQKGIYITQVYGAH